MNPDGTDQMVLFGNTVSPTGQFFVMIDALPIPGSDKVVAVFSPGHGYRENAGNVMIVDPKAGPDDWSRSPSRSAPEQEPGRTWAGPAGGKASAIRTRCPRTASWSPRTRACWSSTAKGPCKRSTGPRRWSTTRG